MRDKPGALAWSELATTDVGGAKAFYAGVFGWECETSDGEYTVFRGPAARFGGIYPLTPEDGVAPCWVPFFAVDDADAAAGKAAALGGAVIAEPGELPGVGRIALIEDPQGALFQVIRMETGAQG
ncbi:MAG TPA: VOC family protein [Longimicrobiaceae bacterium]